MQCSAQCAGPSAGLLWKHQHQDASTARGAGLTPVSILQENGSLLLAQTPAEVASLQHRAQLLGQHGTRSRFMDAAELRSVEPAVALPPGGGGLLVECDAQLVRGALCRLWRLTRPACQLDLSSDPVVLCLQQPGCCACKLSEGSRRVSQASLLLSPGAASSMPAWVAATPVAARVQPPAAHVPQLRDGPHSCNSRQASGGPAEAQQAAHGCMLTWTPATLLEVDGSRQLPPSVHRRPAGVSYMLCSAQAAGTGSNQHAFLTACHPGERQAFLSSVSCRMAGRRHRRC